MREQKKKRFGGVSFSFLEIRANAFDGFGFTLLQVGWNWIKNYTESVNHALLSINWVKRYEYGGEEWQLRGGILMFHGLMYTKVIKPRKKNCDNCGEYCDTTEHFEGNTPFCSAICRMDGIS